MWRFYEPADPQAKGVVERLIGFLETSFEPGRSFVYHHDFQDQLDRWFEQRTAGCTARSDGAKSICLPRSAMRYGRCPTGRRTRFGAGC